MQHVKHLCVFTVGLLEMGDACGCQSSLSQPAGCQELPRESQDQVLHHD